MARTREEQAERLRLAAIICAVLGRVWAWLWVMAIVLLFASGPFEKALDDWNTDLSPPVKFLINLGRWLGGRLVNDQIVPGIVPVTAGAVGGVFLCWLLSRLARRAQRELLDGCCHRCGYDLRGTVAAGRGQCPECGAEMLR